MYASPDGQEKGCWARRNLAVAPEHENWSAFSSLGRCEVWKLSNVWDQLRWENPFAGLTWTSSPAMLQLPLMELLGDSRRKGDVDTLKDTASKVDPCEWQRMHDLIFYLKIVKHCIASTLKTSPMRELSSKIYYRRFEPLVTWRSSATLAQQEKERMARGTAEACLQSVDVAPWR